MSLGIPGLRERGWTVPRVGLASVAMCSHPRLAFPWPFLDAARLEDERDAGDRTAMRLLGGEWPQGKQGKR